MVFSPTIGTMHTPSKAIEALIHSDRPFPEKLNTLILQKADASASYSREFLKQIVEHPAWRNQPPEELDDLLAELMEQGKREGYVSEQASIRALRLYVDIFRAGTEGTAEMLSALSPEEQKQIFEMFFHGLSAPLQARHAGQGAP